MQGFDNLCTSSVVDMCTDRYIERMSTRDLLVDAAADLLQRKGYAGTGVSEVLSASATTKGSLYFHFPGGKEELAGEALRRRGEAMADFIRHLLESSPDAATAISAFAAALAARLSDSDYERGCALATATLDAATESRSSAVLVRTGTTRGSHCWLSASRQTVGPAKTPSPRQFSLCPHSRARWSLLGRVRIPLRFTLRVGFCPNDCGTRHLGVSALSVDDAVSRGCCQSKVSSVEYEKSPG